MLLEFGRSTTELIGRIIPMRLRLRFEQHLLVPDQHVATIADITTTQQAILAHVIELQG